MGHSLRLMLLLPAAALVGCALPSNPTSDTSLNTAWTNWQIQQGTAITSPPNTYPSFTGAIQIQGTTVSATLVSVDSATISSNPQTYTGTYAASTGVVAFSPAGVVGGASLSFSLPSSPYTLTAVSGMINCGLCNNGVLFSGVGVPIASLIGPYTGTLKASTESDSGQVTLNVTQSATPNADGSFSLSGTVTFPASSGLGTYPVSGTISGEGFILYDPTPGIVPVVSLTASTNPAGTQITVSDLSFAVTASNIVAFTGTLTKSVTPI